MNKIKVTTYLKNGVSFDVYVKKITKTYNGVSDFSKLEWEDIDSGLPCLFSINIDDISAIVTRRLKWWQK